MNYYYSIDGSEVVGPYSLDDLRGYLFSGALSQKTQVCAEGTQTWQPLASLGLAPLVEPPPKASKDIFQPDPMSEVFPDFHESLYKIAKSAHKRLTDRNGTPDEIRRENMNSFGRCIIGIGILVAGYFFFSYDTSVHVGTTDVPGFGTFGVERVNNMGLMQNRLLGCTAGMVAVVIGVIMVVMNPKKLSA